MSKIFLGIDPGWGGAIAAIYERPPHPDQPYQAIKCPDTVLEMDIAIYGLYANNPDADVYVAIEYQQSFPKQGISSSFKLGKNYGAWLGILAGLRLRHIVVRPAVWVRSYATIPDKANRKRRLKEIAQQRFPAVTPTLKTADALLLALYAKEVLWK